MKKYSAFIFFLLFSFFLQAQEIAEESSKTIEIKINGEELNGDALWKPILLCFWILIILILVLRTFRGKADV